MLSIAAAMSMAEALSGDNSTDDPAVFDNTGTTLLHLTGNVIDGAASKSLEEDNDDGDGSSVNTTQVSLASLLKRKKKASLSILQTGYKRNTI